MEFSLFLNFLISTVIFFFLIANFFRKYKSKKAKKIIAFLGIIGLFYALLALLFLLWSFNSLQYSERDWLLINSIILNLQSIFFLYATSLITDNKNLFYLLFLYIAILFSAFLNSTLLPFILSITPLLFILFSLLILIIKEKFFLTPIYVGISYSSLSLIFYLLLFLNFGNAKIFSLILNLLFLIFICLFTKSIKTYSFTLLEYPQKPSYFITFFRHFVFILVLTNFVFMGTIGIHEFGHFAISKAYGCEERLIIYEEYPKTEALCSDESVKNLVLYGGFAPFLIAIILAIIEGRFLREISLLITGFNLIACYKDFQELGFSDNIIFAFTLSGILLLIIGTSLLAKTKVEEQIMNP